MGHSVRVLVGSSSGRVMFGLSDISGRFGLGRVWFSSDRFWVNQFLMKCAHHAKTSNFVENLGSGMVRAGSIRVSGEHISGLGSDFWSWVSFARSTCYHSDSKLLLLFPCSWRVSSLSSVSKVLFMYEISILLLNLTRIETIAT